MYVYLNSERMYLPTMWSFEKPDVNCILVNGSLQPHKGGGRISEWVIKMNEKNNGKQESSIQLYNAHICIELCKTQINVIMNHNSDS